MDINVGDYVLVERVGIIMEGYEGQVGRVVEADVDTYVIKFQNGTIQTAWFNKQIGMVDRLRKLSEREVAYHLL